MEPINPHEFYTLDEVSKILKLKYSTLRERLYIATHECPVLDFYRFGRQIRIRGRQLIEYCEKTESNSSSEKQWIIDKCFENENLC